GFLVIEGGDETGGGRFGRLRTGDPAVGGFVRRVDRDAAVDRNGMVVLVERNALHLRNLRELARDGGHRPLSPTWSQPIPVHDNDLPQRHSGSPLREKVTNVVVRVRFPPRSSWPKVVSWHGGRPRRLSRRRARELEGNATSSDCTRLER